MDIIKTLNCTLSKCEFYEMWVISVKLLLKNEQKEKPQAKTRTYTGVHYRYYILRLAGAFSETCYAFICITFWTKFILLKYSWITILCKFQVYHTVIQLDVCVYMCVCVYIYIYIYILQILFPYRLLKNIEYSFLCYTVIFVGYLHILFFKSYN